MPFALVIIGLIMIVAGARDTHAALGKQLQSDFTGEGNFITWIVALGAIGAVGYIDKLRGISHAMMALVIIGLILSNRGFFVQFQKALATGPVAPASGADNQPVTTPSWDAMKSAKTSTGTPLSDLHAFGQEPESPAMAKTNRYFNFFSKLIFGL